VADAGQFHWIVFTSASGVDGFFRRVDAGPGDVRDLKGVKLAALGAGTLERLARRGLRIDLKAPEYRVEAALDAIRRRAPDGPLRVLMPRADVGRDPLADELRRAGAEVVEVAAYRLIRIDIDAPDNPDLYRMLLEGQVDVVTITSASAIRALVELHGAEPMADLLAQVVVASIGPVTAEAAAQYGIRSTIVATERTAAGLVDAIVSYYNGGTAA
jgi:uroporphyrinogen III methyltransferase/synthase